MSDDTLALLNKADALIRRHRVFVAGAHAIPSPHAPSITDVADEADLPVLTEVVTEPMLATAPVHMQKQLDALRGELSRWLAEELPHAVLKVTDGLADQLVGELTEQAEKNLLPRLIERLDGSRPGDDAGGY